MMKLVKIIAIAGMLTPLGYAFAHDNDRYEDRYNDRDSTIAERAVDRLQADLHGERNFAVQDVHVTRGGVACIAYHTSNDRHDAPELAVVNGHKVYVRNSVENRKFVKAWNKYCD